MDRLEEPSTQNRFGLVTTCSDKCLRHSYLGVIIFIFGGDSVKSTLKSVHETPNLLQEWNWEENAKSGYTPMLITLGSNKRVEQMDQDVHTVQDKRLLWEKMISLSRILSYSWSGA